MITGIQMELLINTLSNKMEQNGHNGIIVTMLAI